MLEQVGDGRAGAVTCDPASRRILARHGFRLEPFWVQRLHRLAEIGDLQLQGDRQAGRRQAHPVAACLNGECPFDRSRPRRQAGVGFHLKPKRDVTFVNGEGLTRELELLDLWLGVTNLAGS